MRAGVRVKFLDELRGLAIIAVLFRHAFPANLPIAGIIGVVTFFTLSGYLITGILLDEYQATSKINLPWFYAKRAIRLLPAMLVFLLVWALFQVLVVKNTTDVAQSVGLAVFYLANFHLSINPSIGHLWTLSTEEQFYLIWPALLLLGLRNRRLGTVLSITTAAIAFLLASTVILVQPTDYLYPLPSSWALCLVIGALAFVYREKLQKALPQSKVFIWVFAAAYFPAALIPVPKTSPLAYLIVGPAIAVATATFILLAEKTGFASFKVPGLAFIGKISYAAYLWNYPVSMAIKSVDFPVARGLLQPLAGIVASLMLATISWYLVERPTAGLRKPIGRLLKAE